MKIGIPRERKEGERRVVLAPEGIARLVAAGHSVDVETGAGQGIGLADPAFTAAGACIVDAPRAWSADLVVKVKEVQQADLPHIAAGARLFCFQHLPREPHRVRWLAEREVTAIAFEMVRDAAGTFPLIAPMSVIAGRLALRNAARFLERPLRRVLVLGAGHAGLAAAQAARELGAGVIVLTRSEESRRKAEGAGFAAGLCDATAVEREALDADVVVGAVFIAGTPTPKLLPESLVRRMRPGSVIADVSIDAGGVAETSRPTTHAEPTYVRHGVIHHCIGNLPAAEPAMASAALGEAVLPRVQAIASHGLEAALRREAWLADAVLMWRGRVVHPGIAAEAGLPYTSLQGAASLARLPGSPT